MFSFLYHWLLDFYRTWLYIWVTRRVSGTAYTYRALELAPGLLVGSVLPCLSVFLCCPIVCLYVLSSVLWCPLLFPHKTIVTSRCLYEGSCLIYVICVCLRILVSFCFDFPRLVYPMLPVFLNCPFSVFSNFYY